MSQDKQPNRSRRWLRFGLRSLLVVLTIACVWLAVVFNQCRRQRRAVEAIESAGGQVLFRHQLAFAKGAQSPIDLSDAPIPGPPWLRQVLGDDLFRTPEQVDITGKQIDDAFLVEHLPGVRSANWLWIDSSQVTDNSISRITQFKRLDTLSLNTPQITDATLARLATLPKVVSIELVCPRVTDAGIEKLSSLTSLWQLDITCPNISPAGVRRLKELDELRVVRLLRDPQNAKLVDNLWNRAAFLDYEDTALQDALDEIGVSYGVAIDRTLVHPDDLRVPINLSSYVSFGVGLDKILKPFGLSYYLDAGTLRLAPCDVAASRRLGSLAVRETWPKADLIMVDW